MSLYYIDIPRYVYTHITIYLKTLFYIDIHSMYKDVARCIYIIHRHIPIY